MFMKLARNLNKVTDSRVGRTLFLLAAFFLLTTIIASSPFPVGGPAVEAVMSADAVMLDRSRPERRRVGALLFQRGWALTSDDSRFGGISAMHIADGRVTALSDAGTVLEFALPSRTGRTRVEVRPLPRAAGGDKRDRDTESLSLSRGAAWVGFESTNSVKRFDRAGWRLQSAAQPTAMRPWRGNSGAEAMVRLADGRFLVFSEGSDDDADPYSPVLLFAGDPTVAETPVTVLRYRRPAGFRVTDADVLPDGRLIILNRRATLLDGFSARIVVAEMPAPSAGATIVGREIAALGSPLTVDNMEALSVAREGGRTIVRIASDDNFMPIQRTLLMEFALVERGPAR
jgi:hypothetical protein